MFPYAKLSYVGQSSIYGPEEDIGSMDISAKLDHSSSTESQVLIIFSVKYAYMDGIVEERRNSTHWSYIFLALTDRYLHSLSYFHNTDIMQEVEILTHERQEPLDSAWSRP